MDANHSTPLKGEMENQEEKEEKRNFLFFLSSFFKHVRRKNLFSSNERFPCPDKPAASDSWRGRRLTIQTRSHGHQLTQDGKVDEEEKSRRHCNCLTQRQRCSRHQRRVQIEPEDVNRFEILKEKNTTTKSRVRTWIGGHADGTVLKRLPYDTNGNFFFIRVSRQCLPLDRPQIRKPLVRQEL